jgi:hypothetical protein
VGTKKPNDSEIVISYEFSVQENSALETIFDWLFAQVESGKQSQKQ